jgi:DNA repair exonuclease SbcCD nuclease subunit
VFTFLHAADLHLDSPLRGLARYEGAPVETIRQATRRALENLVRCAIDVEARFVLFAGDIYDGDCSDWNTPLFFISQLVKLREHKIRYYVITGNHDAASRMTRSLELPPNFDGAPALLSHRRAESIVLEDLGATIHGQSFANAAVVENVMLDYPRAKEGFYNIGMLHTSLDAESGEHARYAPCKVSDLADKGYQYWALGHIHKRHARHVAGQAPIAYPGNLQGRHIREEGAKGCLLVRVDDRGETETEFTPLDVFRWRVCTVDAEGAENCDDVLARASGAIATCAAECDGLPTAIRVEIVGSCAAHAAMAADPERWANYVRNAALQQEGGDVWIEKVRLRTSPPFEFEPADGPLLEIRQYIDEMKKDPSQFASLTELLADFHRKLPDELKHGGLALDCPDRLGALLDEVEPLLWGRLGGRSGEFGAS